MVHDMKTSHEYQYVCKTGGFRLFVCLFVEN